MFHHHLPKALDVFAKIAGFSPEFALQCATSGAARALQIDHLTGRLQVGLAADVLLVDGDPLADLAALQKPVGVWARGRPVLAPYSLPRFDVSAFRDSMVFANVS